MILPHAALRGSHELPRDEPPLRRGPTRAEGFGRADKEQEHQGEKSKKGVLRERFLNTFCGFLEVWAQDEASGTAE